MRVQRVLVLLEQRQERQKRQQPRVHLMLGLVELQKRWALRVVAHH
jgi:hypothetical protein